MEYCIIMRMPGLGDIIFGENGKPIIEEDPKKLEEICLKAIQTKNFQLVSIREYKGKGKDGFLLGSAYKAYSL